MAFKPSRLTVERREGNRYTFGSGGVVDKIIDDMRAVADEHGHIIIDGKLISAHAYGALILMGEGRAFWTDRAVLSPHASSRAGLVPMTAYTRHWAQFWPPKVRDWFLNSSFRWRWMSYPELCGREASWLDRLRCDAWLDELVPEYRHVRPGS